MSEKSPKTTKPPALFRWFIKLQNPFMKWLLRSPVHGFVSGMFMLMTVTGRKSGKQYLIPVQYAQDDSTLYIITSEGYTWWKNLRDGAEVTVLLRGETHTGRAAAHTEHVAIREAIEHLYPKLSAAQKDAFVDGKVAIRVLLD